MMTGKDCRFLGIVISMYFDEHNPPHFHVRTTNIVLSWEFATLICLMGTDNRETVVLAKAGNGA